ncbi:MAG: signal peptide peptidase SppA [Desulfobacteraceae bacterium]|nr:signal peptide peptidase SppA [Desulfobacteraceae bacterium]
MFSRRHPYLFFLLVFSAIIAGSSVVLSLLNVVYQGRSEIGFGEKVGIIELNGVITDSRQILEQIKDFRDNDSVKSIVIRIDSPGGAVGPSQEIYRAIRKTVEVKKVIASLGAIAASGGYYISAAADGIVANPGTITGSIGVILGYTNFEALFEKIGLSPVVIKSGEYKDIGSPVRKMTDAEKKLLQEFSDNVHTQFIDHVAEGRKLPSSQVRDIADGRIFSGEKAKNLGLVDRLGNLEDAIEWAGRLGGIKGDISVVYPPEEKLPFMKYLMEMSADQLGKFLSRTNISMITGGYLYQPY